MLHKLALGVALLALLATSTGADELVTLRVAPHRIAALTKTIANEAQPEFMRVEAGQNLYMAIKEQCGSIPSISGISEYWNLFAARNRPLMASFDGLSGTFPADVTVILPACAYWRAGDYVVRSPRGATEAELTALATNLYGYANPKSIRDAGDQIELIVPGYSRPVTLKVKGAEAFARSLFQAAGQTFEDMDAACKGYSGTGPIVSLCRSEDYAVVLPTSDTKGACTDAENALPNIEDIRNAIQLVEARQGEKRLQRNVRLFVADTGLVDSSQMAGDVNLLRPFVEYEDRVTKRLTIGVTVAAYDDRRHKLEPNQNYKPKDPNISQADALVHGTHVIGIVGGASFPGGSIHSFQDYFKIGVLNIINPDPPRVTNREIGDALAEAITSGADVLNLSVIGSSPILNFPTQLSHAKTVVVVAAGNQDLSLETTDFFPAKYGGPKAKQVITVGAYTRPKKSDKPLRAKFSNFGEASVDIVAPGCAITSLSSILRQSDKVLDGTSQAAPFVSLTAALLRYLGLSDAPGAIKERIVSAVDVSNEYEGDVASRGQLNIVKALRFDRDVVTVNGKMRFGKIQDAEIWGCANKPLPVKDLRQLVPMYRKDVALYKFGEGDAYWFKECKTGKTFELDFLEDGADKSSKIPSSEIDDIVFAARPYRNTW